MSIFRNKTKRPKFELEVFKARVGLIAKDDPLWPMLIDVIRANVDLEIQAAARPAIASEEAHRALGRVGGLLDLEAQLKQVWEDSHKA